MKKIITLLLTLAMLMCAIVPMGVSAAAPTDVPLPSLTADKNNASYESSGDSVVYYYTGVAESDYTSYISTLTGAGYTSKQTYTADSCYYALLDNGANTVFVSFLRSVSTSSYGGAKGRLRVFIQKSGTPYHTQSTATAEGNYAPALWQLDVDNSGGDNGGMSYVIRLSDGTFIVIDGAYRTEAEANNLYSILKSNNPLGGKPVVSAWFITHAHIDHYGILSMFTSMYSDKVTVKGFYYNFHKGTIGDIGEGSTTGIEKEMKKWEGATLYSKIHSGMVMGFAGATVEVLATHEDVKQSYYSGTFKSLTANDFAAGNDTSTVIRLNIKGQKIIFLADAYDGIDNALQYTYTSSYLKSDIMQMAHHGFSDGVSSDVIDAIDPDVILWPMDVVQYDDDTGEIIAGTTSDTKTFVYYYNLTSKSYVKSAKNALEVIPAYTNQKLDLPYTANSIYTKSAKTVNTTDAVAAKMAVTNAAEGLYIQKSFDGKSIRFVGVLNVEREELDNFDSVGFDVAMVYNGATYTKSFTTTTVYTSIVANGETVYASEYGGTYFYAIEISGVDFAEDAVEFVFSGTMTYNGFTLTYESANIVVTGLLSPGGTGSIPKFDFADILAGWEKVKAN